MPINNSTTFLNRFFYANDTYSADEIDKKVDAFVISFCLENKMINTVFQNDKRLYHLLPEGKKVIRR